MTRWMILLVAATSLPSAQAGDLPILTSQTRFHASPPGGTWVDSDGLGLIPRGVVSKRASLIEGIGWASPKAVLDFFPRGEGATGDCDAPGMSDARLAQYLVARALARARKGDLRGAAELQGDAILFFDGEPIRTEARRDPAAIYEDELKKARERGQYFSFSLATIDGRPSGR